MEFNRLNKRLEGIEDASNKGYPIRDLYSLMTYLPELWYKAYANIYSNKGAMTKGIDDDTLDGMSKERINRIISSLSEGTYKPKPVRRTYIPKKSGKLRPLGIPSGDDKLVQEVIRIILERIYEPIFSSHSHGFRTHRSCHTALKQVEKTWTGTKWILEFDILGFFDNMNHDIMVQILEKKIKDPRFIKLIKKILKAGYLLEWTYNTTYSGVPQGGIVSPMLSNIYLNELDNYVSHLLNEFNKGKYRPKNPEYRKVSGRIERLRRKIRKEGKNPTLISEIRDLKKLQMKLPYGDGYSRNYKRLRYLRYADDFIAGVIGSKDEAKAIQNRVVKFLKDNLDLDISEPKTTIRHGSDGIEFLSYHLKMWSGDKIKKVKANGTYTTKRTVSEVVNLTVPEHKVRTFCSKNRYGNWQTLKPIHRAELMHNSELEIVETYNSELRGLANYYSLAKDVRKKLNKIEYLSNYSLFKTLASKRQTKLTQVVSKLKKGNEFIYRYRLKGEWKERKVFRLKQMDMKPKDWNIDQIPVTLQFSSKGGELLHRMNAEKCEYCGQVDIPVEVHHVRKLKDLKQKSNLQKWEQVMIARQRKTLILCDKCHDLLHAGKLPDNRYQSNV
jgi:group II intron reverse transcriptase/maturase